MLSFCYHSLGINPAIPDFERFINDFIEYTGQIPSVSNCKAYNLKAESINLTAEVTLNALSASVLYEYGATTAYGSSIDASPANTQGTGMMTFTAEINGLVENTLYHFRIKAANSKWTTYGSDT